MINRKNLWFLTLFSLILVLSVYYVTMPEELLLTNNGEVLTDNTDIKITDASIVEALKQEDTSNTLKEINKLKEEMNSKDLSSEDKNKVFDSLKILNQISSTEELLEEKIKNIYNLDSFVKIDGDEIRVVVDSNEHSSSLANEIMRTVQSNFDTKMYIVVQFK